MHEERKIELASFLVAELAREFREHGMAIPPVAETVSASGTSAGGNAVARDATGAPGDAAVPSTAGGASADAFDELWLAFRAMVNMRPPWPTSRDFLIAQDELLSGLIEEAGIHTVADARVSTRAENNAEGNAAEHPSDPRMRLWRGDITTLATDAIANAANSGMTGCWQPLHYCIDNAIHTFAGIQLRAECAALMAEQGHEEPTAHARVTSAYNLPSKHVIHTVGPIAAGHPTDEHRTQLAQCYRACLDAALAHDCLSIAFCCISTGVFGFPQGEAAEIAVRTVRAWLDAHEESSMIVVFNVFGDADEAIYERLLGC